MFNCSSTVKVSSLYKTALRLGLGAALLALGLSGQSGQSQGEFGDRKFTREELMMVNLAHGKGSAGFFILEAQRQAKDSTRNLERALSQLQQVQASFGKSKGRPDDKFLPTTELKLVQAIQHSKDLEEITSSVFQDMKRSVKETLLKN